MSINNVLLSLLDFWWGNYVLHCYSRWVKELELLELHFYLNTVNLSDKIIIKIRRIRSPRHSGWSKSARKGRVAKLKFLWLRVRVSVDPQIDHFFTWPFTCFLLFLIIKKIFHYTERRDWFWAKLWMKNVFFPFHYLQLIAVYGLPRNTCLQKSALSIAITVYHL